MACCKSVAEGLGTDPETGEVYENCDEWKRVLVLVDPADFLGEFACVLSEKHNPLDSYRLTLVGRDSPNPASSVAVAWFQPRDGFSLAQPAL